VSVCIRVVIDVELGDPQATRSWASAIAGELAGWRVDRETVQPNQIELMFSGATPPPLDAAALAEKIAVVGRSVGIAAAEIDIRCEQAGKLFDDATLAVRE
jgi:hypothetical protein